jgi:hypothetical protein
VPHFIKVMPHDFKRVLDEAKAMGLGVEDDAAVCLFLLFKFLFSFSLFSFFLARYFLACDVSAEDIGVSRTSFTLINYFNFKLRLSHRVRLHLGYLHILQPKPSVELALEWPLLHLLDQPKCLDPVHHSDR